MPLLTNTQLTVSDYYRPVFFSLVDTAVQQLKERFSDSPGLNKYRALEDVLLSGTVDENVLAAYSEINMSLKTCICRCSFNF